jgi:hypothetical protein
VHWPHWHIDLVQALDEHGKRDPSQNNSNRDDWENFEEIIDSGYPFLDAGFVARLVWLLTNYTGQVLPNLPITGKYFIGLILERVRNKV